MTTLKRRYYLGNHAASIGLAMFVGRGLLSIGENSVFEGSSRRVENPTDLPSVDAKGPRDENMQSSALAPYLQRVEASASTE